MAQFPVSDDQSLQEAVNQLLAGPAGLGQNFSGFSAYAPAFLTGNYRPPFTIQTYQYSATGILGEYTINTPDASGLLVGMTATGFNIGVAATIASIDGPVGTGVQLTLSVANIDDIDTVVSFAPPIIPSTYVAPIALSTSEQLDARTYKYTFTSTQATIPFVPGMGPNVDGVDEAWYNGGYSSPGVVECTTDYVIIVGSSDHTPIEPIGTGGTITYYSTINGENPNEYFYCSTDCNAKVLVNGASDRVFVAAQLDNVISFENTITADFDYTVFIHRYKGILTDNPINPEYRFSIDEVVSKKVYHYFGVSSGAGDSPLDPVTTIFTSIIDRPGPGYYWYILDVAFNGLPHAGGSVPDLQVTTSEFTVRSLSAQVVKE
jgi:hypothetical protein